MTSELSIKREYLSGFQGGYGGSCLSLTKSSTIQLTPTTCSPHLEDTIYTQIQTLFDEFGIKSTIVNMSIENLAKYVDIIDNVYCEDLISYHILSTILESIRVKRKR